ncbi:Protein of unknown function [Leuconostoc citreum LBAE C10]|nr:Protein of unknown function [Leuconostoc citreum LBAE C10]
MPLFNKAKQKLKATIDTQTTEKVETHLEGLLVQPFAYKKTTHHLPH